MITHENEEICALIFVETRSVKPNGTDMSVVVAESQYVKHLKELDYIKSSKLYDTCYGGTLGKVLEHGDQPIMVRL
jgi:hypothetical protein